MVDEPQTNRDFMAMLSNRALTEHNVDNVRACFVEILLVMNVRMPLFRNLIAFFLCCCFLVWW